MKRYYDILIDFVIVTEADTIAMAFSSDWRFTEMLDYMCDNYNIDRDSIVEVRNTLIKRYKLSKDD